MVSTNSNVSDLFSHIAAQQGFAGKRVVILGLARQGLSLARYFAACGSDVTVSDMATAEKLEAEQAALAGLPIRFVLGEHPSALLDGCDLLCLSGGVPAQLPIVRQAIERGIPLSNDSLLTLQLAHSLGLGPTIAVTGSSGKTTTTTLVGRMLEAAGQNPHVGGNIGAPLLHRLDQIYRAEPIVLELSSFQLELFDSALAHGKVEGIGPQVAALLNLTPNHLDRHPTMADYAHAKLNLIRSMPPGATLVLNADDPVTARLIPGELADLLADSAELASNPLPKLPAEWKLDRQLDETRTWIAAHELHVVPFSARHRLRYGAWCEAGNLLLHGNVVCAQEAIRLPGAHNISNLLAALATAAAAGSGLNGSSQGFIQAAGQVAETFTGVAHRLEIVAQGGNVTWINDSIATSPERALAGLRAMKDEGQTLILLAGGKDKNLSWDEFATEIVDRVDFLIGFGQSGPMLVELVQDRARYRQEQAPNCAVVQRLEEAVALAGRTAHKKTTVLLSPGGTSYDMYRDFEARGEHFRKLAQEQATGDERRRV